MLKYLTSTFIFFVGFLLPREDYGNAITYQTDSLIRVHGKVMDLQTNSPVRSAIKYQKKPDENNVGIAYSDTGSGEYFFYMINEREYSIEVSAKGYITQVEKVAIDDINKDGMVIKDFALTPISEDKIMSLNKLFFEQSKSTILEESYPELDALVQLLKDYPDMVVRLEGHTDYRGSAKLNMQLSKKRVEAVKIYLIGRGIKKRRVKTEAFGGNKPITTGNTDEARKKNRRVEVRILKL